MHDGKPRRAERGLGTLPRFFVGERILGAPRIGLDRSSAPGFRGRGRGFDQRSRYPATPELGMHEHAPDGVGGVLVAKVEASING